MPGWRWPRIGWRGLPLAGGRRRGGSEGGEESSRRSGRAGAGGAGPEGADRGGLAGGGCRWGRGSSAVEGFGGCEGTRPRATGGAGRRGAATGTRGGVAGLAGWCGRGGGGRARGRAGGAELASIRRPEGAGAAEAGEGGTTGPAGAAEPPEGAGVGAPAGGGAEARREGGEARAGRPERWRPGVPLPGAPPGRPLPPMSCNPSPVSPRSCMDRAQLWNFLPSPPVVAKDYTAYGGRCRRGGRRGPWSRGAGARHERRGDGGRRGRLWGLGRGRGWSAGGCGLQIRVPWGLGRSGGLGVLGRGEGRNPVFDAQGLMGSSLHNLCVPLWISVADGRRRRGGRRKEGAPRGAWEGGGSAGRPGHSVCLRRPAGAGPAGGGAWGG